MEHDSNKPAAPAGAWDFVFPVSIVMSLLTELAPQIYRLIELLNR
jgi:hypothetical protein